MVEPIGEVTPTGFDRSQDLRIAGTWLPKLVYPLSEVAEMTGFSLRSLKEDCSYGRIEHVHYRRFRGMTAEQVRELITRYTVRASNVRRSDMTPEELDAHRAALRGARPFRMKPNRRNS